jgi:hypothetical protein
LGIALSRVFCSGTSKVIPSGLKDIRRKKVQGRSGGTGKGEAGERRKAYSCRVHVKSVATLITRASWSPLVAYEQK